MSAAASRSGAAPAAAAAPDKNGFLSETEHLKTFFHAKEMGGKKIPANKKFAQAQGYVVVNMNVERNLRVKRKLMANRQSTKVVYTEGLVGDYDIDQNDLLFVSHQRSKPTTKVAESKSGATLTDEEQKKADMAALLASMTQVETVAPSTAMPDGVYSCFNGMTAFEEPRCVGFATTNYVCSGPNMHVDRAIAAGLQGVITQYAGPVNIEAGDTLYWDYPDMKVAISSATKKEMTAEDYLMRNYVSESGASKIKPVLRPYRVKSDGVTNIASNFQHTMKLLANGATEADALNAFSPSPKAKALARAALNLPADKDNQLQTMNLMMQAAAEHYAWIKTRTVGKALNSCLANSNGLIVLFGIGREV